jgi:hypothetical protein
MKAAWCIAMTLGVGLYLTTAIGCVEDDWDPDDWDPDAQLSDTAKGVDTVDDTAADTDSPDEDRGPALVGDWTSEGSDISDLFADDPFNIVLVEATFRANSTYEVSSQDSAGDRATFTGTWSVDPSTDPPGITLEQSAPYVATSEGLYAVAGDVLTYEIVQTEPDYGFAPPIGDFGTTTGPGVDPGVNIQTFRR